MNPRWRMLLWEQGRTAGVLCAFIGGIGFLLMFGVYYQIATFRVHAFDIVYIQGSVIMAMLLVAVFCLIVRQDVHAHLVLDFEPRLLRLPVHAAPVALIVFGMRVFFLFILGMALYVVHFFMYHEFPLIAFLVLTLNLFLWMQAFSWARNTITGLSYTIPIVVVIIGAFLVPAGFGIGVFVGAIVNTFQFLILPVSLLYSIPAALGLAWVSIAWRGRDEQHGLLSATDVYRWLSDIGAVRARTFATALDAQLWYEQRRTGRLLLMLTLLFTAGYVLAFAAFPDIFPRQMQRLWFAPHAGLCTAALIAGALALRPRDRYMALRPQTPNAVSMAILLIQMRTLFLCFLLVAVLSAVLMLLHGYDGVRITDMLFADHLDVVGALALLLRPAFAAALIAWLLLWVTTRALFLPIMLIFSVVLHDSGLANMIREYWRDYPIKMARINHWIYGNYSSQYEIEISLRYIIALVFFIGVAALLATRLRHLFTGKQILVLILGWQNVTLLLLAACPYIGLHYVGITTSMFLATLIMLPLCAVPLSIKRRMRSR